MLCKIRSHRLCLVPRDFTQELRAVSKAWAECHFLDPRLGDLKIELFAILEALQKKREDDYNVAVRRLHEDMKRFNGFWAPKVKQDEEADKRLREREWRRKDSKSNARANESGSPGAAITGIVSAGLQTSSARTAASAQVRSEQSHLGVTKLGAWRGIRGGGAKMLEPNMPVVRQNGSNKWQYTPNRPPANFAVLGNLRRVALERAAASVESRGEAMVATAWKLPTATARKEAVSPTADSVAEVIDEGNEADTEGSGGSLASARYIPPHAGGR